VATPGVGQDIEGLCGRCGQTWHVVMAKVGDRIAKVVCKRCGGHHSYRTGASDSDGGSPTAARGHAARSRPRRTSEVPTLSSPPPFDPSKPPRAYAASESFAPGERVIHARFGTGIVTGSPGPGKVAIAFPSAERVLACAKVASTLTRPTAAAHVPVADRPPKVCS